MKKSAVLIFFALFLSAAFSQETTLTAKQIADEAVKKENPQKAAEYIQSKIKNVTVPAEQRALYAFLGSIQEASADYKNAQNSYASAAGIAAGDVPGMQKKSSERLVLDAVRAALSMGDTQNAERYLNSAVRNSKSSEIQATIKLYEQWAQIIKANDHAALEEPLAMLKTYLALDSMKSVRQSVLLTLWYISADKTYAEQLRSQYPSSMEAAIVNGKIQIYPAPFWYFMPRKTTAVPEIQDAAPPEKTIGTQNTAASDKGTQASQAEKANIPEASAQNVTSEQKTERAKKLQLGLFREKGNAQNFADKAKAKGFAAYIQEESRASGTTYFTVVVDENKTGTMGELLKNAGFESYPIF